MTKKQTKKVIKDFHFGSELTEKHPITLRDSQSSTAQSPRQLETQATEVVEYTPHSSLISSDSESALVKATPPEQRLAEVPPPFTRNYSVDVHINVDQEGESLCIMAGGRTPQYGDVGLTHHDLDQKIRNIRKLLVEEARMAEKMPRELPYKLASECYNIFKAVFKAPDLREFMKSILNTNQATSIVITSPRSFTLPWGLIYPVSLNEPGPLSYEHFWGMRYIVYNHIRTEPAPGKYAPPAIPADPPPKLGVLTDEQLGKEISFIRNDLNEKVCLIKLRPLNPEKRKEEMEEFAAFWQESLDLAHFACHCYDVRPDEPCLQLSDFFRITPGDMRSFDVKLNGNPLIVMNACGTGALSPLFTSDFVTLFLESGARGVVATECMVDDEFAADFAKILYKFLFRGKSLGKSLLAARRYFWEEDNNPSGLLYSMYASPSIRIS
jgi:hypothetical protein